jgi:hypothetical protein
MLSFSPIIDPVRDVLDAQVRHVSRLVGLANITVAIGVAMEGVEFIHDAIAWIKRRRLRGKELAIRQDLTEIFPVGEIKPCAELNSDHPKWVKRFTRIGLIVVVVGVVAEWRCGAKLEDAHNAVHEYDLAKLTEADQKAGAAAKSAKVAHEEADAVKGIADEARADAKDALAKAQAAQSELANAEGDAAKAQTAASRALSTADKAESHLAEVAKRAEELTEQLKRLTTPRSLTSISQVVSSLKPYERTQYLWAGVCSDKECTDLLRSIDAALQLSGWKRLPSVGTFPALLVLGKDDPGGITVTLAVGIGISVETPGSSELITKQDLAHAPQHVQAATALNFALAANVYPPEQLDKKPARSVSVGEGTSTTVRVTIGRKSVP